MAYRASKWHYRRRKMILKIIWHLIADTGTDKNHLELFPVADAETAVLCSLEGSTADQNDFKDDFERSRQIQIQANTVFELFAGKKRSTNPNFWVRISSGGVGVFHVKGWRPKSSVCPSKPRETKFLGGIFRDYYRDIPVVPEKFE